MEEKGEELRLTQSDAMRLGETGEDVSVATTEHALATALID